MALTNGCEHNERPEALPAELAISGSRCARLAGCRFPHTDLHDAANASPRCGKLLQYLLLLTYFLSSTHDFNGSSQSDAKYKMSDLGNRSGGFAQVFSVHRVVQFVWGNLS